MDFLWSIFFGAGVAAIAYTKIGRRLGYDNSSNVNIIVGVSFILSAIFFFTILKFVFNI